MSGVGRGIKKVFRGAKKVLKKVAKPALIIGGAFFASGIALGGFSGFKSLMDGTGSIFQAVGKTMAAGAQAIGGALGIGEGVSSELLNEMGLPEGTTLGSRLIGDLGLSTPDTATNVAGDVVGDKTEEVASGGFLGNIFRGFNNLSAPVQTALLQGVGTGFQAYMQSEEAEKERRRFRRRSVWGVPIGEEFGSGIGPQEITNAMLAGYQARPQAQGQVPPLYQGLMAPPTQNQPAPISAYPNPYTNTPPPPASSGPLLG